MQIFTVIYETSGELNCRTFATEAWRTTFVWDLLNSFWKRGETDDPLPDDMRQAWEMVREDDTDGLWLEETELQGPMPKLAVILEGGLCQGVVSDHPELLPISEAIVIDYDTDGVDPEYLSLVTQDSGKDEEASVRTEDIGRATLDLATFRDLRMAECQNCGAILPESDLQPIKDLHERVAPGEKMPAGECPSCGCLAHVLEKVEG